MENMIRFIHFITGSVGIVIRGSAGYYVWLAVLGILIAAVLAAYGTQLANGLITSNMRDQVSWGFYI